MTKRKTEPVLSRQLSLDLRPRTRGGARPGAGRPRKDDSERGFIPHRTRAVHRRSDPVHVTVRVKKQIPSLRSQVLARLVKRALLAQREKLTVTAAKHFQVVHFTIQADHIHLIVEAPDKRGIARGVAGLEVRIARSVNKLLKRKGRFWSDRYHRRDLRSPTDTRNVLRYVLANAQKHHVGQLEVGVADPHSSAPTFDGFVRAPNVVSDPLRWPHVAPRTWLLGIGWRACGLLDPADLPRSHAT